MSEIPDSKGIELPDISILNEEEVILFADTAMVEAGNSLTRRGEAINQICELIFKMEDPVRKVCLSQRITAAQDYKEGNHRAAQGLKGFVDSNSGR